MWWVQARSQDDGSGDTSDVARPASNPSLLARKPHAPTLPQPPLHPALPLFPPRAAESCRKFKSLASMGFKSEQIVGALILAQGDENAAAQTCLDAS